MENESPLGGIEEKAEILETYVQEQFQKTKEEVNLFLNNPTTLLKIQENLQILDPTITPEVKKTKSENIIVSATEKIRTLSIHFGELEGAYGEYNPSDHSIIIDLSKINNEKNPKEFLKGTLKHEILHASGMDDQKINSFFIEKFTDTKKVRINLGIEMKDIKTPDDLLNYLEENQEKHGNYFTNPRELYVRFKIMKDTLNELGYGLDDAGISQLYLDIQNDSDGSKYKNIQEIFDVYDGQRKAIEQILNSIVQTEGTSQNSSQGMLA